MNSNIKNFKDLMSLWTTGVAVITTIDDKGKKYGFTANSFTSVSLDPLLILFCLKKNSPTLLILEQSKKFALSILSKNQEDIAKHFATPLPDKFMAPGFYINHSLTSKTKCPVIDDALGWIDCNVKYQYPGGDHDIFVGEVIDMSIDNTKSPLIYYDRKFLAASNNIIIPD